MNKKINLDFFKDFLVENKTKSTLVQKILSIK